MSSNPYITIKWNQLCQSRSLPQTTMMSHPWLSNQIPNFISLQEKSQKSQPSPRNNPIHSNHLVISHYHNPHFYVSCLRNNPNHLSMLHYHGSHLHGSHHYHSFHSQNLQKTFHQAHISTTWRIRSNAYFIMKI